MYLGRIVEEGPTGRSSARRRHPYTALLLASRPGLGKRGDPDAALRRKVAGEPASPASPPPGLPVPPPLPARGRARAGSVRPDETVEPGEAGRRFACHDPEPPSGGNFSARSS